MYLNDKKTRTDTAGFKIAIPPITLSLFGATLAIFKAFYFSTYFNRNKSNNYLMKSKNDKVTQSLTEKSMIGFAWSFLSSGGQALFQLLVLIVLARLLSPTDFGIVGSAVIVTQFSNIFSELGVGPAIVQRLELKDNHLRVGFTLSVVFGIAIGLAIYSMSPFISSFFKNTELELVLDVYSIIFIFKGFSLISESLLQRSLKFKAISLIDLLSYIIGYAGVGIILALNNYGYWSLVGAHMAQAIIKTIGVISYQPHPIKPLLDKKIIKELLYFGSGHTLGRIANYLANQGDNLVIGRTLGTEALGNYGRAYQLVVMPANLFGQVFDKVLFPAMSKAQDDLTKLSNAYKRTVSLMSLVIMPFSCIMWILSPEIISLILGEKWIDLVEPFRILSIGLLFRVVHKISDALARSKGAVFKRAGNQILYAIMVLCGAWIGHKNGITGVASGVLIAIFINYLLMAKLCCTLTGLPFLDFCKAHAPGFYLCAIVFIIIFNYTTLLREHYLSHSLILGLSITLLMIVIFLAFRIAPNYIIGKENIAIAMNLKNVFFSKKQKRI